MPLSVKDSVPLGGTLDVAISAASSGVNAIVAAIPGKRIRVTQVFLVVDGAVTVEARSAANPLSGPLSFAANGGVVLPYSSRGWWTTAPGEALNFNLGGAVGVRGTLKYDIIN